MFAYASGGTDGDSSGKMKRAWGQEDGALATLLGASTDIIWAVPHRVSLADRTELPTHQRWEFGARARLNGAKGGLGLCQSCWRGRLLFTLMRLPDDRGSAVTVGRRRVEWGALQESERGREDARRGRR